MGFDLVTFLAQIVNLAILVWVLKRFLYTPIMAVIEKRQNKIAADIQSAQEQLAITQQTQKELTEKLADFEAQRQKRFAELDAELQEYKSLQTQKMEQQFHEHQLKMQQDLNHSWQGAQQSVRSMVGAEFMNLTKTVLTEWSDNAPVDQVLILFQKKLDHLTKRQQNDLTTALSHEKNVLFTTSEKLNKAQQQSLTNWLNTHFKVPAKTKIQFKTDLSFILGMEMRIGQYVAEWNLKTYLDELQQNLTRNISGIITPQNRKGE